MAKGIKDQLLESGEVTRGYIGVNLQELTAELADYFDLEGKTGVIISDVLKDSPADKAGIKANDIILEFNGEKIEGLTKFRNDIAMLKPGTEAEFLIDREGKQKTVTITIGEMTDDVLKAPTEKWTDLLGFKVDELTEELAKRFGYQAGEGVIITEIIDGGQAQSKGIKVGSVILSVNRKLVDSVDDFNEKIKESMDDGKVLLLIKQGRYNRLIIMSLEQ